jgi:hypothetical protein
LQPTNKKTQHEKKYYHNNLGEPDDGCAVNDNVKVYQKIIQKYTISTECCKSNNNFLQSKKKAFFFNTTKKNVNYSKKTGK